MSAGEAGQHVVDVLDSFYRCVPGGSKKSQILYLIDYIVYGLHLWYKVYLFKEILRQPCPDYQFGLIVYRKGKS